MIIHGTFELDSSRNRIIDSEKKFVTCNPNEFFEVEWVSSEELFERIQDMDYEPWSKALINWFN